jgi:hypothetical protein
MSRIILGTAGKKQVGLDLGILLTTRMLLTADSGGGKTFALKRICEQVFGRMQILIVDPEGEFSPLRKKLDFVLVGKGGETPADVRSAALLAQTLLRLRACAICDIFELKPRERHAWVRTFLEALIEAPKETRHPCLVIVDEAHMFCPEKGKGESEASDSMIGLCTRGRKRLLCPLFATQRLATLSKDASSMLLNRMIGPTFEDLNRKRAADTLSVAKEDEKEFFKKIQTLEPGNFFCLGRAISKERILIHVGPIATPHGQEAIQYEMKPPPAPDKIRAMLPKLAELPKAAEEQARTTAEFRAEIRELKVQLRAQPAMKAASPAKPQIRIPMSDPRAIGRAVNETRALFIPQLEKRGRLVAALLQSLRDVEKATQRAFDLNSKAQILSPHSVDLRKVTTPGVPGGAVRVTPAAPSQVSRSIREPHSTSNDGEPSDLTRKQQGILKALAQFEALGRSPISKKWIAALSGASHKSSAYTNNLGALRSQGLIQYDGSGNVLLTAQGRGAAPSVEPPAGSDEILDRCLAILTSKQQAILKVLYEAHPHAVKKQELAEKSGASPTSSAYTNNLGALRSAGMIEYAPDGAKCAGWLFLD